MVPYDAKIWVKFSSGDGLLPDGTKPLPEPEPMLTYQSSPVIFNLRAIPWEIPQPSITKFSLKIAYLKFYANSPAASELTDNNKGDTVILLWIIDFTTIKPLI